MDHGRSPRRDARNFVYAPPVSARCASAKTLWSLPAFSNQMQTHTSDASTPSSGKTSLLDPWKAIYYHSKTARDITYRPVALVLILVLFCMQSKSAEDQIIFRGHCVFSITGTEISHTDL